MSSTSNRIIPKEWMDGDADRLVTHWTAGAHDASANDRAHYHFLFDGKGKVVRGDYNVSDNLSTNDGRYAGHTYGLNTRSIGVSMCCMAGASEGGSHGSYPMTEKQYQAFVLGCADLCEHYHLDPLNPREFLSHGEVTKVYGIDQWGKWDILELSFAKGLNSAQVSAKIREDVAKELSRKDEIPVFCKGVRIGTGVIIEGRTYTPARDVAQALGATVEWDPVTRQVMITPGE